MTKLASWLVLALAVGCSQRTTGRTEALSELRTGVAAGLVSTTSDALAGLESIAKRCRSEIQHVEHMRALPGAPGLESSRPEVLARAKAEPVLFLRAPEYEPDASVEVRTFRGELERARPVGPVLARLFKASESRPELARQVLLREGYLYAEDPVLAIALVEGVELGHLFDDPEVVIERGDARLRAVRREHGKYELMDGADAGKRAHLLLFDRVWAAGASALPPLHVALRGSAEHLGFDRLRVARLTESHVLAELRYGDVWVKTLFERRGATLERSCELVPKESSAAVEHARSLARRHEEVLRIKRRVMLEQVAESLPFDEPKTEDGQQDGNLRPKWIWAYTHGWETYEFNDDRYPVFDAAGRPRTPQVCVDFIMDTLERASGTRWRERGAERQRIKGLLDFNDLEVGNRRSVERFVEFAEGHPAWFDVYRLEPEERIPFWNRARFFEHLRTHADRYRPGDIVIIHGLRDDNEYHYHSFYVFEADPETGMPMLLAANAGRPRIRTWDAEMRNAPKRSIKIRVRPKLDWLETILPIGRNISVRDDAPAAPTG